MTDHFPSFHLNGPAAGVLCPGGAKRRKPSGLQGWQGGEDNLAHVTQMQGTSFKPVTASPSAALNPASEAHREWKLKYAPNLYFNFYTFPYPHLPVLGPMN